MLLAFHQHGARSHHGAFPSRTPWEMATLGEDASFDAPLTCANNPNASAMGAAEWAACAGSSGEAYAPFVTIIEAHGKKVA